MLILALDCSSQGCSAVVWRDGVTVSEKTEKMDRGQDQRLMPLLIEVTDSAGVTFDELDRVAVTRGPGSFTGLRIGLAAARGIGLAARKPVIGIDRFAIYRRLHAETEQNLLIVLQSKRAELFCQFCSFGLDPEPATMLTSEQIVAFLHTRPNTLVAGDAQHQGIPLSEVAIADQLLRETVMAAEIAAGAQLDDQNFLPRPLYIRAPDVTLPKLTPRIRSVFAVDAPLLVDVHGGSFGDSHWTLEQLSGSLELETTLGWAALVEDKISGFILVQVISDEVEILTFAVDPAFQRRGLGTRLLAHALEAVTATQERRIFLEVASDNHAATALYEKAGFIKSGRRPKYYARADHTVDAVVYERPRA